MMADKARVGKWLRTVKGQVEGILGMIDEDRYCLDISHQILAATALLRKANREIIEAHLQGCVKDVLNEDGKAKIDEIVDLVDRLG